MKRSQGPPQRRNVQRHGLRPPTPTTRLLRRGAKPRLTWARIGRNQPLSTVNSRSQPESKRRRFAAFAQVGQYPYRSEGVVRGGVEPPTFRFSGGAVALFTENVPAWKVPAVCPRLPVIVIVVVRVVVDSAHALPDRAPAQTAGQPTVRRPWEWVSLPCGRLPQPLRAP